jgi:SMODS-associating 4TM effector domain
MAEAVREPDAEAVTIKRVGSGAGQQHINARQNEPIFLEMLHAADVAHAQAQRWEVARAVIAIISSCGSLIAAFLHEFAIPMSIVGGSGSVVLVGLTFVSQTRTKEATRIQERFDVELFNLPTNSEFNPLPADEEIGRLARRYHKKEKRDWYVDVSGLPLPYAVLLCQRENLLWDWPLRRKWASLLLKVAAGWSILGLVIALSAGWTTRELLLRWMIPSLPGLILATNLVIKSRQIARDKQQLALNVDERLGVLSAVNPDQIMPITRHTKLMSDCRAYQDRIFRLRNQAERVPGFLYRRHKAEDEELARTAASRLRARLLGK